jgi:hypothetical protein
MPEISRFYGIVITMYFNGHQPPHFHARYGGREAVLAIHGLNVIAGTLTARAMGLVEEWGTAHRRELLEDWDRAGAGTALRSIEPLP